jgi:hypothetical protein
MTEFSVSNLPQAAIQYLHALREAIWIDPPYQRMSDIWPLEKRQLLIDSVINGFDIPKLYFHELAPARHIGSTFQKYAIIDGKQRLESLWAFMDGKFALAQDFEYLHDESVQLAGLTYKDIGEKYPLLKSKFDATSLSVVSVRTGDVELIDEMFSRLNEAVPLNAPEKRNAFGGSLPTTIRELAAHQFFASKLPYPDRRFKHRDLAAKFLLIEHLDTVTDTKKVYLDRFVRDWAEQHRTPAQANTLKHAVEGRLAAMSGVFVDQDELLRSIGMTILLFHLFRLLDKLNKVQVLRREHLVRFEEARQANRQQAEADMAKANYDLIEFDKYVQTPNDAYAIRIRLSILVNFLREALGLDLPKTHEYILSPS